MEANRRALSGAAFAGMFVFGIVMALLGAVLPALSGRLAFRLADIGTLFLAMNLSMLACSSIIGLAIDRYGMKPPLAAGPLLVGAALALMASAAEFTQLLPAAVLLGVGGGALNAATNTLVADLHDDPNRKAAALNVLGIFFGFGALLLPFCVGALLEAFGIGTLLVAASVLCAATAVFAASLQYPAPKQRNRLPVADMPRFLRSPLVLVLVALLFFQSGIEFTMGGYVSTYLTRAFGMTVQGASWVLAAYWAAIMLARVLWSRLMAGVEPASIVAGCAAVAAVGAALTAAAPTALVAGVGICLTGLALSGIFPTTLGIAGAAFREFSGTVFGILFTAALAGGTLMPWTAGRLAEDQGLGWVFGMVALAFVAITVLAWVSRNCRTAS